MSKLIKMTPECLAQCKKEFEEALSTGKFTDGKITFTKTLGTIDRKAILYFSEMAWIKMHTLIREFDKEVAWHGVAYRGEDKSKDEYFITDILVYPQVVTGATVNTDQDEYTTWLFNHDDDVFPHIRMQGHSHVNMGTTPSVVDNTHQEKILDQLEDDMFYIFMIWNKRKEKFIKIYDLEKNVLFETADVTVTVLEDEHGMEKFLKDAKEMVKTRVVTTPTHGYCGYQGYGGYGGYGAGKTQYGGGGGYTAPAGVTKKQEVSALGKNKALTETDNKKKKGKRKGKRTEVDKNVKGQVSLDVRDNYCMGWDDDYDYGYDDYFGRKRW